MEDNADNVVRVFKISLFHCSLSCEGGIIDEGVKRVERVVGILAFECGRGIKGARRHTVQRVQEIVDQRGSGESGESGEKEESAASKRMTKRRQAKKRKKRRKKKVDGWANTRTL